MALNSLHAAHIRGVVVTFSIIGRDLDPAEITAVTGLNPDASARTGEQHQNPHGQELPPRREGRWSVSTRGKVVSKDVREHFHYLLERLLPHSEALREFAPVNDVSFGVIWKSTYLYAGTGPLLDARSVSGAAALGAGMAFDIYQVDGDADDGSNPPEA